VSANKRGWMASMFNRAGATPPVIPAAPGGSVAPPAPSPAAALSSQGTVPPPPLPPPVPAARTQSHSLDEVPRLLLVVDATGSRADAWRTSQRLMASLIPVLPGGLEIALAVYGGGEVHTFTPFTQDVKTLQRVAAGITCEAGGTQLLDILDRIAGDVRQPAR
jgi:hypothetical protein